ncbi:GTPase [Aureococcus anophagefferens]|nr:GTPase [Aureococcus anophagefferens]
MGGVDRQCKIVLIGDGSVGKSSLIARFRTEGFAPHYAQTIGVDFFEKRLELRGSQAVKLQIWDIGGQSIHSKMLPKYLYKAAVVLIVYDLTNSESLLNVDDWLAALRKVFVDKYTGEKLRMPHTSSATRPTSSSTARSRTATTSGSGRSGGSRAASSRPRGRARASPRPSTRRRPTPSAST